MAETTDRLVERLTTEGEKVTSILSGLTPSQWQQRLYTDGACWTVRDALAHFVASEQGFYALISDILSGGQGAPEDFNINRYNETRVNELAGLSPAELLSRFAIQRRETCKLVAYLSAGDLARTGRHPFLGLAPVEDMVKLIYRHNQIHLRDIRKALQD